MSAETTFGVTEAARITGVSRDRLADWLSRGVFRPERPQRELRPELTLRDLYRIHVALYLRALGLRPEDALNIPYALLGDPATRAQQDMGLVRLSEDPGAWPTWREVATRKVGSAIGYTWAELVELQRQQPVIIVPLRPLARDLLSRVQDYLGKGEATG
jgi:hypothetical protein